MASAKEFSAVLFVATAAKIPRQIHPKLKKNKKTVFFRVVG